MDVPLDVKIAHVPGECLPSWRTQRSNDHPQRRMTGYSTALYSHRLVTQRSAEGAHPAREARQACESLRREIEENLGGDFVRDGFERIHVGGVGIEEGSVLRLQNVMDWKALYTPQEADRVTPESATLNPQNATDHGLGFERTTPHQVLLFTPQTRPH